jgi:uncharacterized glyoxalase superfamily protein PhnB
MTTSSPAPTIWPILTYADAPAAVRFLTDAFGFAPSLVVPGGSDGEIAHAEMRFPEGGGVMFGSVKRAGEIQFGTPGGASVYVVTDSPDELFTRATKAGAEVVRELTDQDYGSREFSVKDPEGNTWSFGTYRGA